MYNIILFWFVIFGVIYVFTKKEEEETCDIDREEEKIEEKELKIPCRRDELSKILKDGIDQEGKNLELKRFKHRCFNCGTEKNLELDHHLPLSKGYPLKCLDVGSNTVVLCKECNRKKGDRLPEEFYTEEKLKNLEEMGIRSHLYYSPRKIIELENLMIGEKIKKIDKAIDGKSKINFTYYDMSKILFLEERIETVPLKVHSTKDIRVSSIRRDWYLEGSCNKLYNIRWMFDIRG